MGDLFGNRVVVAVASAIFGIILTLVTERISHKRGLFTYSVWHNRVGVSAEDRVFGSVQVTWNNNPVANLFSSTVEMRNESLHDYENVIVHVYSANTILLNEQTGIVGSVLPFYWTER